MIEPAVAVVGIFVCWLLAIVADGLFEERGFRLYFLYAVIAAVALYFLVRFVHWAWVTPMPFVG